LWIFPKNDIILCVPIRNLVVERWTSIP
jgi:hypothetical protein